MLTIHLIECSSCASTPFVCWFPPIKTRLTELLTMFFIRLYSCSLMSLAVTVQCAPQVSARSRIQFYVYIKHKPFLGFATNGCLRKTLCNLEKRLKPPSSTHAHSPCSLRLLQLLASIYSLNHCFLQETRYRFRILPKSNLPEIYQIRCCLELVILQQMLWSRPIQSL